MNEQRFLVQYEVPYTHTVQIGILADTKGAALEKARDAFFDLTLWDDNTEFSLVRDVYEERIEGADASGDEINFEIVPYDVEDGFPKPDECVLGLRRSAAALRAAELLVAAYKNGEDNGGTVEWDEIDQAYEQARQATGDAPARPINGSGYGC